MVTKQRVHGVAGEVVDEMDERAVDVTPSEVIDPEDHTVGGIERAAGGWVGLIDFDAFIEELYERRRQVDQPPVNLD